MKCNLRCLMNATNILLHRFGTMTRVYYRYAIAAVIVYDVTRHGTFEAVTKWRDDINSKVVLPNGEQIPIMLLANKCDLAEAQIDSERLDEFCRVNGFIGWFATSAQDNVNVDEAMKFLVAKILDVGKRVKVDRPGLVPSHNSATLSVMGSAAPYNTSGGSSGGGGGKPKDNGCC
jgi:Ras-related protein Rab-32